MKTGSRAPPEQQGRDVVQLGQPLGHRGQGGPARVVAAPAGCRPRSRRPPTRQRGVGVRLRPGPRGPRAGSGGRDSAAAARTKAGVRTQTRSRSGARPGQPDQRRGRGAPGRGAPRCWPAPVRPAGRGARSAQPSEMGPPQSWATGDHGTRRCPAPRSARPRSSIRSASRRICGQPFGPAHAQLVDRDHPPARRGGGQEPAPQIGPGGVAVDAEHRPGGRLGAVVQHVPGAGRRPPRRARSPGATSRGRPRPGPWPGRAPTHQVISA